MDCIRRLDSELTPFDLCSSRKWTNYHPHWQNSDSSFYMQGVTTYNAHAYIYKAPLNVAFVAYSYFEISYQI